VTPDRRGFGDSTWEAEPFSHVDDLLAVMDALDVPDAVLVGNSQRGRVAVEAALGHSDRVTALVLVSPAVSGAPWAEADLRPGELDLEERAQAAADSGDLESASTLEAHLWLDGPLQPEGRVTGEPRELFLEMNGRALTAPEVGEPRWDVGAWSRLAELRPPVTIVVGDLDEAPHLSAGVADRIPEPTWSACPAGPTCRAGRSGRVRHRSPGRRPAPGPRHDLT
jgi:pimeloyl-ACP methyl ester carboxylesterase